MQSALLDALLGVTPHVRVGPTGDDGTLVWADARGLSARDVATDVLAAARRHADRPDAASVRLGVSRVAVAAEVAARTGVRPVTGVPPRQECAFLASRPLHALLATEAWPATLPTTAVCRTVDMLTDVGIVRCGELAALAPDAVAARYGAAGAALWRLACADDPRRLFAPRSRALPSASLAWTTYELRDTERLAFPARRLVERVMEDVRRRGDVARTLTLALSLGGGATHETTIRGARPSCDVAAWSRLVRDALDRVSLRDGVVGLSLRVDAVGATDTPQGDLFDRGFGSGAAAERAIAEVVDSGAGMLARPSYTRHTLPERRATASPLDHRDVTRALRAQARSVPPADVDVAAARGAGTRVLDLDARRSGHVKRTPATAHDVSEVLTLRVMTKKLQRLVVTTSARRDTHVPSHYREWAPSGPERRRVDVVTAFGPDRVAVDQDVGVAAYREYWQCLTSDGQLVLIYQDGAAPGTWYLHGWWD